MSNPIKVKVDSFKPDTGKYYSGGEVELPSYAGYVSPKLYYDILLHQKILTPSAVRNYIMVVTNVNDNDPFACHLFKNSQNE